MKLSILNTHQTNNLKKSVGMCDYFEPTGVLKLFSSSTVDILSIFEKEYALIFLQEVIYLHNELFD